jgi:hypothetical protein
MAQKCSNACCLQKPFAPSGHKEAVLATFEIVIVYIYSFHQNQLGNNLCVGEPWGCLDPKM